MMRPTLYDLFVFRIIGLLRRAISPFRADVCWSARICVQNATEQVVYVATARASYYTEYSISFLVAPLAPLRVATQVVTFLSVRDRIFFCLRPN